jgi:hypothetical protein
MNSSQLQRCKWLILQIARLHKEIADKISAVLPHGSAQCAWAQAVAGHGPALQCWYSAPSRTLSQVMLKTAARLLHTFLNATFRISSLFVRGVLRGI